jgi:hypothetical protein
MGWPPKEGHYRAEGPGPAGACLGHQGQAALRQPRAASQRFIFHSNSRLLPFVYLKGNQTYLSGMRHYGKTEQSNLSLGFDHKPESGHMKRKIGHVTTR